MQSSSHKRIWAMLGAVFVFCAVLVSARLVWIALFSDRQQPHAINGVLDLRGEDISGFRTLTLDGEWVFYSNAFMYGEMAAELPEAPHPIQVPGGWNDELAEEGENAYGYGTYRLRVLVDEGQNTNFSVRVPSVRSSSELYVNGQLLMQSGKIATNEQEYWPWNVPYTASFSANGQSEIEIVIQAANFRDPRSSGIIRSIKFGPEAAIGREVQLSVSMQLIVSVVLIMHSVYAFMLYWLGNREKRLLYYSLLALLVMAILVLSSEEKLMQVWFLVSYDWSFKLLHLFILAAVALTFLCFGDQLPAKLRKLIPYLQGLFALGAGLTLFASVRDNVLMQWISLPLLLLSGGLVIATIFKSAMREARDHIMMLFAVLAVCNQWIWWTIMLFTGIKVIYYPFDLIIAIGCFVAVWFKKYFRIHFETRRLAEKLQRADKQKDEFLANTSHELRNPLHGILNISQAVLEREKFTISEKSAGDLGTVLNVGRRMSLMLNDLLDAMQLKEGTPRLRMKGFYIHSIAAGIFDMLRYMIENKPVKFVNEIPEDIPQVWADENRIVQIVFNLLHNAVKFTHEGEISIGASERNGRVYVTISDTGTGMDGDTLGRIFEPYEQGDSGQTMMEGGFGLGLSISKQLAELHGGQLDVLSKWGEGSSFTFSLPVAEKEETGLAAPWVVASEEAAAASAVTDKQEPIIVSHINRPRILVVDDDPVNCNVLATVLSTDHYEIGKASSASQALEELEKREWDLVISDVMMPHMSGYELTREIRKRHALTELPVLLLTARNRPENIQEGFSAGANDYVSKPVEALELRSRVRMLTEVKQSVRERLQMEAAWLQAQIQPHFLFNSLNTVSALSEIDLERMRRMLDELGQLLRHKFRFHNFNELIPIEEELNTVRSYLYIEQVRFEERLLVEWEIEDCTGLRLPPLTIQPLVENSIKHGIMSRERGGTITISVKRSKHAAWVTVKDDGVGMEEAISGSLSATGLTGGDGVGLSNTDLRLKRHFGEGLSIESRPGQGTSVSFAVPSA